jgi:hypothetical protein
MFRILLEKARFSFPGKKKIASPSYVPVPVPVPVPYYNFCLAQNKNENEPT